MKKAVATVMSMVIGSVLVGCQTPQESVKQETVASISGTLAYRERMALPGGALVTVTLQDISLADAPAKVIAKHRFETNGMQVPFTFDLAYHTGKIDTRHSYSVNARIEVGGKLLFITDTSYPVITDDSKTKQVDLLLVRAQH